MKQGRRKRIYITNRVDKCGTDELNWKINLLFVIGNKSYLYLMNQLQVYFPKNMGRILCAVPSNTTHITQSYVVLPTNLLCFNHICLLHS